MAAKYVPPHRRSGEVSQKLSQVCEAEDNMSAVPNKSVQDLIPERCGLRCAEWLRSSDAKRCPQHEYYDQEDTRQLAEAFAEHAQPEYSDWMHARQNAESNEYVQQSFAERTFAGGAGKLQRRNEIQGAMAKTKTSSRYDSRPENIASVFNRFLYYAIEINNGVHYVEAALADLAHQSSFTFLDLGFAPGGMSQLLLGADERIQGTGVTLPPEHGGNVYPHTLAQSNRYTVVMDDILKLVTQLTPEQDAQVRSKLRIPAAGFDLVIIGITISGSHEQHMQSIGHAAQQETAHVDLKDQLHIAQLLLAFRYLRPGGRILQRMHMTLRPVDVWQLALIVARSDSNALHAVKPVTEFANRKTFWIMAGGFTRLEGDAERLRRSLLRRDLLVMQETVPEICQHYFTDMIRVLRPMWRMQTQILHCMMGGFTIQLCHRCKSAMACHDRRRPCHTKVIPIVLDAHAKVTSYLQSNPTLIMR